AISYAHTALAAHDEGRRPVEQIRAELQARMSRHGALVRDRECVSGAVVDAWALYREVATRPFLSDASQLPDLFRCRDLALAHAVYLEALAEYVARGGQSRGSCLVVAGNSEATGGFAFSLNEPGAFVDTHILEVSLDTQLGVRKAWADIRPIPSANAWFESVWKAFRNDEVVR
ncbi:MAG: hypothetical protein ACM3NQ_00545, partial [Bacteroidales bacterium]